MAFMLRYRALLPHRGRADQVVGVLRIVNEINVTSHVSAPCIQVIARVRLGAQDLTEAFLDAFVQSRGEELQERIFLTRLDGLIYRGNDWTLIAAGWL
jgi:hypothetical protein